MDKQVIFKSVLNGFEKNAVLRYIDELNSKLARANRDLEELQESSESEKDELADKAASLELNLHEVQKKLEEEQTALAEKQASVEELSAQLRKLQIENEEKEHELIMLREQNRLIREQAEAVEAKSRKYDEAAASIGDVILDARKEAKHIIAEAQTKAEGIIADAEKKAEQINQDAENNLSGVQKKMDQLKSQFLSIREQMNSSVALLNDQFGQVEASMTPAEKVEEVSSEETKAAQENPLKAILEQANAAQKKNFFRE